MIAASLVRLRPVARTISASHQVVDPCKYPIRNLSSLLNDESDNYNSHELPPSDNYSSHELPPYVADLVREYTSMDQTPFSLQMLMRTGRGDLLGKSLQSESSASDLILIQMASFLRQEIPIRLAYRIQDLDQIPILRGMEAVQRVKKIYYNSLLALIATPAVNTKREEENFAMILNDLYAKHSGVLVQMARGAYELRAAVRKGEVRGIYESEEGLEFERMHLCHNFLDRFYTSRIGIRVLAGQYLALRGEAVPNYIGMIHLNASPNAIVQKAAEDATFLCKREYGKAPRVEIIGRLDLTFPYIPTYLHYILLELLKNAMRASAEQHMGQRVLPPVTVVIADGQKNEDVVIKIMDEGGGIRRSQVNKIWSYLFTTASSAVQDSFIGDMDHGDKAPIAGLGYGLPISRSYCRYFGGDLDLMSMDGYGTDAFLHLKRLGDSEEPLPL
mmetsp:Transcript_8648/g.11442  ORF Transcript_8648/g.11442 Transcript_8648/m.11442 type:complete len:445 (+) Transcript_8648:187-1521(+)|eukprot:CAMPEP_0198146298 /NCGR_PEP_ID=MMETSP1443-20131203/28694_1 /TAXON_ID=186043 /ORGANISM="Entomoneis sp., Strain CCMP2396" /LENGTH=444 /DNA_ID=CAMNT_0043810215 /DNA_START=116 /DNA_END=1450 /DNA_ORIENTATION=+